MFSEAGTLDSSLPPATAMKSIFSQMQYALYLLIGLLSAELTVLVIFKLVSKRQEIWYFHGCDWEVWCLLECDAVLSDGNIPTFQRNRLSSLLWYVTLLEMSWSFRKHLFRDHGGRSSRFPSKLRHTPTKVHGVTSQSTAVFTVRHVTFVSLALSLSYCYHFPYVGLASVSAVCCLQQWINDVSSSLSLVSSPHPAPKKTYPHHTCSYSRSLPGFIRKFQSWWNVSLPASIARTSSLAVLSYVQRGKLIRNGALGWGPYCLVIFM